MRFRRSTCGVEQGKDSLQAHVSEISWSNDSCGMSHCTVYPLVFFRYLFIQTVYAGYLFIYSRIPQSFLSKRLMEIHFELDIRFSWTQEASNHSLKHTNLGKIRTFLRNEQKAGGFRSVRRIKRVALGISIAAVPLPCHLLQSHSWIGPWNPQ